MPMPEDDAVQKRWKRLLLVFSVVLLLSYVGTYAVLSRRGYADADQYNMKGFYYFFPEESDAWRRKNYGCVYLFSPINAVDRWLGSGRHPASEPLWGLSNQPNAAKKRASFTDSHVVLAEIQLTYFRDFA